MEGKNIKREEEVSRRIENESRPEEAGEGKKIAGMEKSE